MRAKLQCDYRHQRFIATVPGRGYRSVPTFTDRPVAPAVLLSRGVPVAASFRSFAAAKK